MIKLLPHWALTDLQPAFYDVESKTAVQMVARLYSKMQELIEDYNGFIDEINKTITEFQEGIIQDFECFKNKIVEIVNNYIETVDLKIQNQDAKIDNFISDTTDSINERFTEQDSIIQQAVDYMQTNLVSTLTTLFNQVIEDREITLDLGISYDHETENLQIGIIPIVEDREY